MKRNIMVLTTLVILGATAQAADTEFPKPPTIQTHMLNIKGYVVTSGCAIDSDALNGGELYLQLDQVPLEYVKQTPTTILNSLDTSANSTLVCPSGIDTVQLALMPRPGEYTGDLMHNTAEADAAKGIGFKVAAAFGEDLPATPTWVDFSINTPYTAQPDHNGKVAINFGANYALTSTLEDASAGGVEAKLPFKITYM
ncbi:fimbrial protein [Aeromonas salmonicida]|uniref:fimbrial protein n=1 Tax=Aeromonas salmonicida TaxID=645 RepID=UPI000AECB366|nr:fimbrial protein [Aeromonas salmonicida]